MCRPTGLVQILKSNRRFGSKRFTFTMVSVRELDYVTTVSIQFYEMSRLMGKPTICIGENKDADQLRGNREADQRLCFRYSDSTVPLLLKSEISSF